jgi:hypothetical protein
LRLILHRVAIFVAAPDAQPERPAAALIRRRETEPQWTGDEAEADATP